MSAILHESSTSITLGVHAFLNDDYVPSRVPNLRDVTASHTPKGSGTLSDKRATTIFDVNQWIGCSSPIHTPSVLPTTEFNHASAQQALKQQVTTFGAIRTSSAIKTSKVSYKVALKHAALCKTLNAAFATRGNYGAEWLSLDSNQDSGWIPTTESPMDSLEEEDNTSFTLSSIYAKLTPKQTLVAELLSDGKNQTEIATILNITQQAVNLHIKAMRARLSR